MSLRINTNVQAMAALRELENVDLNTQITVQRLSSGIKISSAADDPSGLVVSDNMTARLLGVGRALSNSQDSVNLLKTADGAMAEISNLLGTLRSISVAAANSATLSTGTLQAFQAQVKSILQSIDRIGQQTQFGSKKLLDGTSGVVANITDTTDTASLYFGSSVAGARIANGPVTATLITPATKATIAVGQTFASSSAALGTAGSVSINGVSVSTDGTDTLSSFIAKINAQSNYTGVTAQITGGAPNFGVTLVQSSFGSQNSINFIDPGNILNNAAIASASGTDAVASIDTTTSAGVSTALFTGGIGGASGLKLTDVSGNMVLLTAAGNAGLAVATQVGQINAGAMQFQNGADANQTVMFSMPKIDSSQLGVNVIPGLSLNSMDITSTLGAQAAIQVVDDAISQISLARGEIGSMQSGVLQSSLRTLQVSQENLQSSRSEILDADMAAEYTQYTKEMILQQSGISVLSHANQQPNNILNLLQR